MVKFIRCLLVAKVTDMCFVSPQRQVSIEKHQVSTRNRDLLSSQLNLSIQLVYSLNNKYLSFGAYQNSAVVQVTKSNETTNKMKKLYNGITPIYAGGCFLTRNH